MPYLDPKAKKLNADAYRKKNKESLAKKQAIRQKAAKEADPVGYSAAVRERSRIYRENNKERVRKESRARNRRRYEDIGQTEEYKVENRARVKAWREANREHFSEKARNRRRQRYAEDVQFKLSIALRRRLYMAVKNNHRSGIAVRELGCSVAELKNHIEKQFKPGMTWENWAVDGWHIDHKRPLCAFDLSDVEQVKRACHYTNLQPLWWQENVRKDAGSRSFT